MSAAEPADPSSSASSAPPSTAAKSATSPTSARRGLLFITFAKLWFMIAAYAIQFGLPPALGSVAKFGVWTLVLSLISPLNNVLVTANIQAVSKFSAAQTDDGDHSAVIRAGLRLQSYVASATWVLFIGFVPVFAWFEHDMTLLPTMWLASGVVLAYSFYAVFVGAANGTRQFQKQAALDILFSTMRAAFVIGVAALTHSVTSSVGGFVVAAGTILIVAYFVVGLGAKPTTRLPLRPMATYFAKLALPLLILNLVMFVDGYLLKRLASEAATAAGAADEVAAAAIANVQVGYYGAVQAIARLPYQLILAVTFIVFPLMAKATFDEDRERARGYAEVTMRYSLLVLTLLASVLCSRPAATLGLLYRPEYSVGASALPWLMSGYVAYALITIGGTVLNSAGRTRRTTEIAIATLAIAVVACDRALVWAFASAGRDPLFAVAAAAGGAMIVGAIWTIIELYRYFGARLRPVWIARTALMATAIIGFGRVWPTTGFFGGKLGSLIYFSCAGILGLIVAVGSGELRPGEIRAARTAN